MQKYFKYKYKYFWEKVFKIQAQNTIHVFKIVCLYGAYNTCSGRFIYLLAYEPSKWCLY